MRGFPRMGCAWWTATLMLGVPTALHSGPVLNGFLPSVAWTAEEERLTENGETYSGLNLSFSGYQVTIAGLEIVNREAGRVELAFNDLSVAEGVADGIAFQVPDGEMLVEPDFVIPPADKVTDACGLKVLSLSLATTSLSVQAESSLSLETGPVTVTSDWSEGCVVLMETAGIRIDEGGSRLAEAEQVLQMFRQDADGVRSFRASVQDIGAYYMGTRVAGMESLALDISLDDGKERWYETSGDALEVMASSSIDSVFWNAMLDDESSFAVSVVDLGPVGETLQDLSGTSILAPGRTADLTVRSGQSENEASMAVGLSAPGLLHLDVDLELLMEALPEGSSLEDTPYSPFLFRSLEVVFQDAGLGEVLEAEVGLNLAVMLGAILPAGEPFSEWRDAIRTGEFRLDARPGEPIAFEELATVLSDGDITVLVDSLQIKVE